MPTCSRQTLVKDHAFLVKPAYYLKSLYGVRGFGVCDIFFFKKKKKKKKIFFFFKKKPHKQNCGFEEIDKIRKETYYFIGRIP